jgi:hypothetical protein
MVREHLASGEVFSTQYPMRCAGCTNSQCRNVLNPAARATRRARGEQLKPVAG